MDPRFQDNDLSSYFDLLERKAKKEVADIPKAEFGDADVDQLTEALLSRFAPRAPLLRRDRQYALEPEEIHVRVLDYGQEISQGATRITIAVPFEGDRMLFTCEASASTSIYPRAKVGAAELLLTHDFIQSRAKDPKATFDRDLDLIDRFLAWTRADVERFIPKFRQTIQAAIRERRDHLASAAAAVAALGVPVKPRERATSSSVAATLAMTRVDMSRLYTRRRRRYKSVMEFDFGMLK